MSRPPLQTAASRRHFRQARAQAEDDGWLIFLDDRPLSTPRRRPLRLPSASLAQAIAAEWNALDDRIDPRRLPLTALANAAIDLAQGQEEEIRAELLG
ncbi:MAG: ATPase, partial [Alphaproteobacteria bacterium]